MGENYYIRNLTCFLAYAGFLSGAEFSVLKRYDVNIKDTYMRLCLEDEACIYIHCVYSVYSVYIVSTVCIDKALYIEKTKKLK